MRQQLHGAAGEPVVAAARRARAGLRDRPARPGHGPGRPRRRDDAPVAAAGLHAAAGRRRVVRAQRAGARRRPVRDAAPAPPGLRPRAAPAGRSRSPTCGPTLGWITKAMETGERRTVVDAKQLPVVRRIVHGLELGEVGDGPLTLSVDWRRRIDQQAAVHGVTGDLPVEDVRRWIGEVGPTGLDRLGERPRHRHLRAARRPGLGAPRRRRRPAGPRPDRPRATPFGRRSCRPPTSSPPPGSGSPALFGIRVPDVLFARNVRALAERTRAKVRELEPAVNALWRALQKHAADLGLAEPGPRTATAQAAADLLARLSATRDDPALVRVARRRCRRGRPTRCSAPRSSPRPAVLAALDGVEWSLLESVRALVGHEVARRARGAARRPGGRGGPRRPVHARPGPGARRHPRPGRRARVRGRPVGGRRPTHPGTGPRLRSRSRSRRRRSSRRPRCRRRSGRPPPVAASSTAGRARRRPGRAARSTSSATRRPGSS